MKANIQIVSPVELANFIARSVSHKQPFELPDWCSVIVTFTAGERSRDFEFAYIANRKTEQMKVRLNCYDLWLLDDPTYDRVKAELEHLMIQWNIRRVTPSTHQHKSSLSDAIRNDLDDRIANRNIEPEKKYKGHEMNEYLNLFARFPPDSAGLFRTTALPLPKEADIGAWTYPFPVITTAIGYKRMDFVKAVRKLQDSPEVEKNVYRTIYIDPWTGKSKTLCMYKLGNWTWRDDYIDYLELGVLPTREFYKMVTGKTLDTLVENNE